MSNNKINLAWFNAERNRLLKEHRPQGEWIELPNYRHECSICKNSAYALANLTELLSNFCPNCGARMT